MSQLVQLQEHADEFKALNVELVFVFREEGDGIAGLKKIKEKHQPTYRLTLDPNQTSKPYSPKRMTFDNYVISADGIVRGIVDGTLTDRATAEELMKILQEIEK
jgi:peroxiredoxin